jgi:hypothetical protein
MRELAAWDKHEKRLELADLLRENFLVYEGAGPVPPQVYGPVTRGEPGLRDASPTSPEVVARARGRWYLPDPNRAQDLEKLRERELLKEFEQYKAHRGRSLGQFRLESVRAGFRRAWAEKDYQAILQVARLIPTIVLEDDPQLFRWSSMAANRAGDDAWHADL